MRRLLLPAMLILVTLVTGCDMFRAMVGRPTSKDIEAKAVLIREQQDSVHKAHMDSLKRVEQQMKDSIAVMDTIAGTNGMLIHESRIGGMTAQQPEYHYYIIIGAFMDMANAQSKLKEVSGSGLQGSIIQFRNGFNDVALCPSNSLVETFRTLQNLKRQAFCPKDAWILVND